MISFTALLLALAVMSGAQVADINESAIRIMHQAITPQRDGSHVGLLFALRQLRDNELQAFFHQLAQRKDSSIQAQAALGLAELNPKKRLDPWLITQLDASAQEAVIAGGLDLELLGPEQIPELLKEQSLQPMARLFLLAESVMLDQPVEQQPLIDLSKSEDHHISGLAACLLAQLGTTEPLTDYQKRTSGLAPETFNDVVGWCLEAIRRYKLTACVEWVRSLSENSALSADLTLRCVLTLLEIDPVAGLKAWERALGANPSYGHRVRCGLLLLAAEKHVPATTYERIRGEPDEELIEAIIAMGRALSEGSDPLAPLKKLIDLGHQRSTEWAMTYSKKLTPEQLEQLYVFLIDRIPNPKPEQFDSKALAVQAVGRLLTLKPQLVFDRLQKAEDDGEVQQAILLGMCETDSPAAGEAASKVRRIGSGSADSLALLLIAKHSTSLPPADLEQLGKIAAGGGRLSLALQIQAAWLYLKHTGQKESAMAKIFAN